MTKTSEALAEALWQSWINGNRKTVASAVLNMTINDRRGGIDTLMWMSRRWPHEDLTALHKLFDMYDYDLEM